LTVQGNRKISNQNNTNQWIVCLVPPRIVEFRPNPPLHTIRSGSSLSLFCRAEGTPMPQIRWRIRDTDVNQIDLCK